MNTVPTVVFIPPTGMIEFVGHDEKALPQGIVTTIHNRQDTHRRIVGATLVVALLSGRLAPIAQLYVTALNNLPKD